MFDYDITNDLIYNLETTDYHDDLVTITIMMLFIPKGSLEYDPMLGTDIRSILRKLTTDLDQLKFLILDELSQFTDFVDVSLIKVGYNTITVGDGNIGLEFSPLGDKIFGV